MYIIHSWLQHHWRRDAVPLVAVVATRETGYMVLHTISWYFCTFLQAMLFTAFRLNWTGHSFLLVPVFIFFAFGDKCWFRLKLKWGMIFLENRKMGLNPVSWKQLPRQFSSFIIKNRGVADLVSFPSQGSRLCECCRLALQMPGRLTLSNKNKENLGREEDRESCVKTWEMNLILSKHLKGRPGDVSLFDSA